MKSNWIYSLSRYARLATVAAVGILAITGARSAVAGGPAPSNVTLEFDLELNSLDLSGGPYPVPLASDPGNALGDTVDGYGFVDSTVGITTSSQRQTSPGPASLGHATAFCFTCPPPNSPAPAGSGPQPINPAELDGHEFFVESFFDVFFDITISDVDARPGRDFAGQSDGASIFLMNNGPARIQASYMTLFDEDAPNFGLGPPPEADPFIGLFSTEIPFGFDINKNGENDKVKITAGALSASDTNRTFITLPDGTVVNQFDTASLINALITDESTDPPFTLGTGSFPTPSFGGPGAFTGPATTTSNLLNPIVQAPEPGTLVLFGIGLGGLVLLRRRRKPI